MIENHPQNSNENSEFEDNVFGDDPFCEDDNDQSNTFDNEIFGSPILRDFHYHLQRRNFDSEHLHFRPRSFKFQTFNQFHELFDLPDLDTLHHSATSLANQSELPLHFDQSQASSRKTRTKNDLRQVPGKEICLFFSYSSRDENSFSRQLN